MKNFIRIYLEEENQITKKNWRLLTNFVEQWNDSHQEQFKGRFRGRSYHLTLLRGKQGELIEKVFKTLHDLQSKYTVFWEERNFQVMEEKDYLKTDWVKIVTGIPPMFIKEKEVCTEEPCFCDNPVARTYTQKNDFIVDERWLNKDWVEAEMYRKYPEYSWDLLNNPIDGMIISDRLVNLFTQNKVRGYKLRSVISLQTGRESDKIFQLLAIKTNVKTCAVHTGWNYCSECGCVLEGESEENNNNDQYFRSDEIEGIDVFSDTPWSFGSFWFSKKVYHILVENKCNGFNLPILSAYICRH